MSSDALLRPLPDDPLAFRSDDGSGSQPNDRLTAAEGEIAELRAALTAANERERALRHELQHRVRNMLSVIRSVLRRTREAGASPDEFAEHFQGRLDAIARHQSYLDHRDAAGIDLEDMLRDELLEAHCLDGPNCAIDGPPVALRADAALLMALAIHELTTNSIKFGALAHRAKLAIGWTIGSEEGLAFHWSEAGVSPVSTAPRPVGFGRQLIEEALPYQLDAATAFELKPGGLDCRIALPAAALGVGALSDVPTEGSE